MDFSQSTKQLITNFINSITSKIDNKISDHNNVHGSTSNFGHTKAGGVPQNISSVGSAGTDNGYYARADHVHKASFNDLADKPDISGKVNVSDVKDNLTSTDTNKPLSANQGKVLKGLVDGKASSSHTHGDITNTGTIGTVANKPLITSTNGKIVTGSFGKLANTFAEGNHIHEWDDLTYYDRYTGWTMLESDGAYTISAIGISYDTNQDKLYFPCQDLYDVDGVQLANLNDVNSKVNINQGTANNGKFLKVDSTGKVACESVTIPSAYTHPTTKQCSYSYTHPTTKQCNYSYTHPSTQQCSHTHTSSQITDLMNKIYPIGAIYISVNNTSPATLFGGTWQQLTETFLYATSGTADTGYQATAGSKDAVVVSHSHTQNSHNHDATNSRKFITVPSNWDVVVSSAKQMQTSSGSSRYFYTQTSGGQVGEYAETTSVTPTINSNGVDGTGKNMPPYMKVYMWKRTA